MKIKFIACMLLFAITAVLSGCSRHQLPEYASLVPVNDAELKLWAIPDRLISKGDGNSFRVLAFANLQNQPHVLELASGGNGSMEYFYDIEAGSEVFAHYRLQFLSTQGTGRIKLSAFDAANNFLAAAGWVFTGDIDGKAANVKWLDQRFVHNYKGGWLDGEFNVYDLLKQNFAQDILSRAAKYRLSVEVGQGQHVLVSSLNFTLRPERLVRLNVHAPPAKFYSIGDLFTVEAEVENISDKTADISVKVIEPYGFGLLCVDQQEKIVSGLPPRGKTVLSWQVRAQRANEVNLGKPWNLQFSINGRPTDAGILVSVKDTRPGIVAYVMTEDLEPIDAAGYPVQWGNSNGWLEPSEYLVQMVNKPGKLNEIAEKYGAKWTHYIAWPAVEAGEWADKRSATGKWREAVNEIKESVRRESSKGHEYAVHMHTDYDPYIPGNVLSYNKETDGVWANHLKHGWAHSLYEEGDFLNHASRTGSLYYYRRILDELSSQSGQGQILTARVGSFDFGSGSEEEAKSIRVYKRLGLWGSSDADGNIGGRTSADFGGEIYFTAHDDINARAIDLKNIGIVEFRPTPKECITYDSQPAEIMNGKADQGMAAFAPSGKVIPGVHAIIGFTHAMFVMGDGGWQSTDGGQFKALEDHLAYLSEKYAKKGLLHFKTASELVRDYLDYYTPKLLATYGDRIKHNWFYSEYNVILLGKDIPVDDNHRHEVTLKYPLYLRDSAYRIYVYKDGKPIYATSGLPTPGNDITFTVDSRSSGYSLRVYHNAFIRQVMTKLIAAKTKI